VTGAVKPLPRLDDANRPFWDGARIGELRLQRCLDCGTYRFPAARLCTACRGERSEWVATSGRGTVDSVCVFHKGYFPGLAPPYNVVVVTLAEGVKLFSNLLGLPDEAIRIGMAVEAVFEPATDAVTLVKFKLAEDVT
jgi:uncharacterized OB-fold protein